MLKLHLYVNVRKFVCFLEVRFTLFSIHFHNAFGTHLDKSCANKIAYIVDKTTAKHDMFLLLPHSSKCEYYNQITRVLMGNRHM